MQFLNPYMLWSALAISLPIILHFWHQKKGKIIQWATTHWLLEKDQQPSRGIRLENLLILILRCLALLLLTFFISKPIFNWLNNSQLNKKIHFIQNNKLVANNFKFELDSAIKNKEEVYTMGKEIKKISSLGEVNDNEKLDGFSLQSAINKYSKNIDNQDINLYFINSTKLQNLNKIFVPNSFKIHAIIDTSLNQKIPFIQFSDNNFLFLNQENQLENSSTKLPNFRKKPNHNGKINILISEKNTIIEASLKALSEVYKTDFSIDSKPVPNKIYDFIFPNKKLKIDTDLSEKIAEEIAIKYDLKPTNQPLSTQQLNSLFETYKSSNKQNANWLSDSILGFLILVLMIERWLSIRKNV